MYQIKDIIYNGRNDPYKRNDLIFGTALSNNTWYCLNHYNHITKYRFDSQVNSGLIVNFRHHILFTGLYDDPNYFSYVFHKGNQTFKGFKMATNMIKYIEYGNKLHLYFLDPNTSVLKHMIFCYGSNTSVPCQQTDIDANIKTLLLRTLDSFDPKKVHDGDLICNANIYLNWPPEICKKLYDCSIVTQ